MEMRCYRKILRISYKDHVTEEEVRAKSQQAIGAHEDLLTIVKKRKLQWYGHVSRSSGVAKWHQKASDRESWRSSVREASCNFDTERHEVAK